MGDDDQINIIRGKGKLSEIIPNVTKKMVMAGIYENPFFSVNEKGIAVIFRRVEPQKGMQVVKYFHLDIPLVGII